jgi:hypothetical protein
MSPVTFESVLRSIERRVKKLTNGKYECHQDSLITTGHGIIRFIRENYESPFPELPKFPYHDFPIFENEKYILVSTLDSEFLGEDTISDKNLSFLLSNRDTDTETKFGGLTIYYGKGERYIEIHDDTSGLVNTTFILFS